MKGLAFALMMALVGTNLEAAEYWDYMSGSHVEITDGLVAEGEEVEFYDWNTGSYHYGGITGIDSFGDIELLDYETDTFRHLEPN